MDKEAFRAWNERMAREYDPEQYHESSNCIVRWIEGRRVRALLKNLGVQPHHSVLEVGVGAGNILEKVRAEKRVGLDLSPFLLEKAQRRLGEEVDLIEGDAEELSQYVKPASFDRIFCSEVLEHVQHPDRVLAQMSKAVRSDGVVVVSVPNENVINMLKSLLKHLGVFRLLFPKMADHMEDEWHVHIFGRSLLWSLCTQDFHIERVVAVPFFFLPIRLVARLRPRVSENQGIAQKLGDSAFKNFFKRRPQLYSIFLVLLSPLMLFDFLFVRLPGAELCAAGIYTVFRTPS